MTICERLFERLERAASLHGTRPFLIGANGDRSLDYAAAAVEGRRAAAALAGAGIGPGDRVVIIARNRPEVIAAVMGASRLGAAFSVLNPRIPAPGLRSILEQAEPAAIVVDEECALDAWPGAERFWAGAGDDPPTAPPIVRGDPGARTPEPADVDPDDVACLVFTSGSTGAPRGVVITHRNLEFSIDAIQARVAYREDDVVGLFLPLAFDYGLYQVFLALSAGAAVRLDSPAGVGPFMMKTIRSSRISVLPLMPTLLARLIALFERGSGAMPSLRAITSTGEHLAPSLIDHLTRRLSGVGVYSMYGLTECKRVSILLPEELDAHKASVGRPLDGTEVFAVGADGTPLPPHATGELVVRGPNVTKGYWRAEADTAQRFRPAPGGAGIELHTGDLGSVDADGYVFCFGRRGDLIKHRGVRMSPIETETAARCVSGVREAALIHDQERDRIHLFLTSSDAAVTSAGILMALRDVLEPEKVPEYVHVLARLPTTAQGKLDRRGLAQLAEREGNGRTANARPARKPHG